MSLVRVEVARNIKSVVEFSMTIRTAVEELRRTDPQVKAAVMARELGKTREAVRLALIGLGLPTSFSKKWYCEGCGKRLDKGQVLCRKCWSATFYTTYPCEVCGKEKKIRISQLKRLSKHGHPPRFCSNKCQGVWLGSHFGFNRRK